MSVQGSLGKSTVSMGPEKQAHIHVPKSLVDFLGLDNRCTLEFWHPNAAEVAAAIGLSAECGEFAVVRVNRFGAVSHKKRRHLPRELEQSNKEQERERANVPTQIFQRQSKR